MSNEKLSDGLVICSFTNRRDSMIFIEHSITSDAFAAARKSKRCCHCKYTEHAFFIPHHKEKCRNAMLPTCLLCRYVVDVFLAHTVFDNCWIDTFDDDMLHDTQLVFYTKGYLFFRILSTLDLNNWAICWLTQTEHTVFDLNESVNVYAHVGAHVIRFKIASSASTIVT